ncbi:hypothetical protein HvAV-3i_gp066 [Heliothis virescens ascovirus 3i]|nr:hypothetical protein HvAV-3i_gp066 [Heliothis virescens ascovirus 3i]
MDRCIEEWEDDVMDIVKIEPDIVEDENEARPILAKKQYRPKTALYQKLLMAYEASHEVKLFAMDLFMRLVVKKTVGDRKIPRHVLMAACVCCAQCHYSAPNNKARVAEHFGNITIKHLRRAILAVKREDPVVRTQHKTDTDRLTELCDSLRINEHIESVIQFYRQHQCLNKDNLSCIVSPRTRCAAYIYAWLKLSSGAVAFSNPKIASFSKACHVSPNGFNSTVRALLADDGCETNKAPEKTLTNSACCSCRL